LPGCLRLATTLDLLNVATTDSGGNGFIDPNETVGITATFRNYVTNPLNADKVRGATATLTTTTDNVSVLQGFSPIHNLDPGQSGTNDSPFVIRTAPGFVPGTPIELVFTIRSAGRGTPIFYFPNGDMAMWAGDSNGPQHVHMRLPGMAETTAQLRFEFAQDSGGICSDVRPTHTDCGVSVDNIVVRTVVAPATQP